jgi:hypothetical protein
MLAVLCVAKRRRVSMSQEIGEPKVRLQKLFRQHSMNSQIERAFLIHFDTFPFDTLFLAFTR